MFDGDIPLVCAERPAIAPASRLTTQLLTTVLRRPQVQVVGIPINCVTRPDCSLVARPQSTPLPLGRKSPNPECRNRRNFLLSSSRVGAIGFLPRRSSLLRRRVSFPHTPTKKEDPHQKIQVLFHIMVGAIGFEPTASSSEAPRRPVRRLITVASERPLLVRNKVGLFGFLCLVLFYPGASGYIG